MRSRRRRQPRTPVRLLPDPVNEPIAREGGVRSVQEAEVTLSPDDIESVWRPEYLERLARGYWRYLSRISLGLLRVIYAADSRTVVLVFRPLSLLRFGAPEYAVSGDGGIVTWKIERGLLVQRSKRGRGHLRISVHRFPEAGGDGRRLRVSVEVRNFYPWLRGAGWFSRFGTLLYGQTQMRLHRLITRGFLRDLARFDLPPLPGDRPAASMTATR